MPLSLKKTTLLYYRVKKINLLNYRVKKTILLNYRVKKTTLLYYRLNNAYMNTVKSTLKLLVRIKMNKKKLESLTFIKVLQTACS